MLGYDQACLNGVIVILKSCIDYGLNRLIRKFE